MKMTGGNTEYTEGLNDSPFLHPFTPDITWLPALGCTTPAGKEQPTYVLPRGRIVVLGRIRRYSYFKGIFPSCVLLNQLVFAGDCGKGKRGRYHTPTLTKDTGKHRDADHS